MGLIGKLLSLIVVAVVSYFAYKCMSGGCHHRQQQKILEKFRNDGWFGSSSSQKADPIDIHPFRFNVSQNDLDDVRNRLERSRFIDHIDGTGFNYGFNSVQLKKIQNYWLKNYDWRKQEKKLNSIPQFKTKIEGIDIHFAHIKAPASAKTIVPLLMVHGWPGSWLEFIPIIPLLTNNNKPDSDGIGYELIIPSIPGYGFSEAPHQTGFNMGSAARIFTKLMKRLGHERFFAHGGDWGSAIVKSITAMYPEKIRGVHMIGSYEQPNSACDYGRYALAYFFPKLYFYGEDYQRQWNKLFPFGKFFKLFLLETGYMHLQSTKPDTIGSALMDTPIGLAAYILEKFSSWTNWTHIEREDGGFGTETLKFTMDDLLNNVMLYWFSNNIASSQRFYLENMQNMNEIQPLMSKIKSPSAIIDPENDMMHIPRKLVEPSYENLLQFNDYGKGGHFFGMEEPELLVKDLHSFVNKVFQWENEQTKKLAQSSATKKDEI